MNLDIWEIKPADVDKSADIFKDIVHEQSLEI